MEIQEKYLLIFCLYRSTIIWLSAIKETHIPYTWKGTANIMLRQKTKHVNDFGKDSVPSLVLRVSIPFMFAQFVNVLYSIVDRIYVGNIPEIVQGRKIITRPIALPFVCSLFINKATLNEIM